MLQSPVNEEAEECRRSEKTGEDIGTNVAEILSHGDLRGGERHKACWG
jgi:hypothetical protein